MQPYWLLIIAIVIVFLMVGFGKTLDHLNTQRTRLDLLHDRLIEVDAIINEHINTPDVVSPVEPPSQWEVRGEQANFFARNNVNLQREAMKAFAQARAESEPKITITQLPSEPPRRKVDDRANLIADTEP